MKINFHSGFGLPMYGTSVEELHLSIDGKHYVVRQGNTGPVLVDADATTESNYLTIGYVAEACELADEAINRLSGLSVEITTADGETFDALITETVDEWTTETGHGVRVRDVDEDFDPVGPARKVDAKHITVY